MKFQRMLLGILLGISAVTSYADEALLQNTEAQEFIQDMVKSHNFSKKELTELFREAQYQKRIIDSMDRPYEKKSWDAYKKIFLTQNRIDGGVEFWKKNKHIFQEVEAKYGVPPQIILAILGVETLYGKRQGSYRVLDSLTTLAFNYPKRSKFFSKELREYLILCREQHVSPTKYYGSYAGAIGMPQFMPSSYRYYAVNPDSEGGADLMNDDKDVIYSIANYFVKNGWKRGGEVAEPAEVTSDSYKNLATNTRTAGYKFTDVLAKGVKPKLSRMRHPNQAGLIELDTGAGNEYWLGYHNFYVITRYNHSPQYALVVHILSNELKDKV